MTYNLFIYIIIAAAAILAVTAGKMLTSAIMLAVASIALSLLLFNFNAPWAAVFELSVCAGLITVLFISAVSLVKKEDESLKESRGKFLLLPFLALAAFIIFSVILPPWFETLSGYAKYPAGEFKVGEIIWNLRSIDLLGQVTILAAAVFVVKSVFGKRSEQ
ncbi:MAG: NADH-quinone oxidoreductase subunit J [Elusimicrobiota bacterium]